VLGAQLADQPCQSLLASMTAAVAENAKAMIDKNFILSGWDAKRQMKRLNV